jgi:sugar phosphate isomerase/epimerase
MTRRSVLSLAAIPLLRAAAKKIPIGLEMYSVRETFEKDPEGSLRKIARMGYQDAEIYSVYTGWSEQRIKQVRQVLDDSGLKCLSTHNSVVSFQPAGMQKAIDYNGILGSRFIVMASPGAVKTIDGWKHVADMLTKGSEQFAKANLRAGYHNHTAEFTPLDGQLPMKILAADTPHDVMLQLDCGHCVAAGGDPVAWIREHPGRIQSLHLKDWSPELKLKALLGQGIVPWKKVFAAAEKTGGVEFYLVEQEDAPDEFVAVKECLAAYRKLHG